MLHVSVAVRMRRVSERWAVNGSFFYVGICVLDRMMMFLLMALFGGFVCFSE